MLKLKKLETARKLVKLQVTCEGNHTTIPMEFLGFDKNRSWNKPVKAIYNCVQCNQKHLVFYSNFTFFNRFSELKVKPIIN